MRNSDFFRTRADGAAVEASKLNQTVFLVQSLSKGTGVLLPTSITLSVLKTSACLRPPSFGVELVIHLLEVKRSWCTPCQWQSVIVNFRHFCGFVCSLNHFQPQPWPLRLFQSFTTPFSSFTALHHTNTSSSARPNTRSKLQVTSLNTNTEIHLSTRTTFSTTTQLSDDKQKKLMSSAAGCR